MSQARNDFLCKYFNLRKHENVYMEDVFEATVAYGIALSVVIMTLIGGLELYHALSDPAYFDYLISTATPTAYELFRFLSVIVFLFAGFGATVLAIQKISLIKVASCNKFRKRGE